MSGDSQRNEENTPHFFRSMLTAMRHNILNPQQSMGITHWAKVGQYYSSSSRSTWLWGRCGRHNYPTASILPKLKLLPPTTEAFRETVKRAHFKLVFGKLYCNKIRQSRIDLSLVGHPKDDQVPIAQSVSLTSRVEVAPSAILVDQQQLQQ